MGLFDFIKRRWGQDPEPVFPREALMPWVHRRSHLEILKSIQLQRGIAPINLTCTTSKALAFTLAACPTPQLPKGPPPEYEEPPAPSWLRDAGGGDAAPAAAPPS